MVFIVKDNANNIKCVRGSGNVQLKEIGEDKLELTIDHLRLVLEPHVDELGLAFIRIVQQVDERQLALFNSEGKPWPRIKATW